MAIPFADQPAEYAPGDDSIVLRRSGNATPFPYLNPEALVERKDLPLLDWNRFLWSPVSEDWITWNAFQLMAQAHPDCWWKAFGLSEAPAMSFWKQPVELVLSSPKTLVYAETRQRHDATGETLDEKLKQLTEQAEGRRAEYWFFLKARETPHRLSQWLSAAKPDCVLVRTFRWTDLLAQVSLRNPEDNPILAGVKKELRRRTGVDQRVQPSPAGVQEGVLNSRRRRG
jgi:hypothetical protein